VWLVLHKKGGQTTALTYADALDEALCFGWIDAVRRRLDEQAYTIRFTPRRPGSTWSAVNIARAQALIDSGRMAPAGLAAFEARQEKRTGIYSYEQRRDGLTEPYAGMLAKNRAASSFFVRQSPSYRRAATWWVISAKREETRLKRVQTLIDLSAKGRFIPQFIRRSAK
jgi:uncharacterized protein YdeI (YjbR/CyaY-like superfamily)